MFISVLPHVYEIERRLQSGIFLAMPGFVNGCGCVRASDGTAQMGFMSAPEGREMDGGLTRV
jgi:hypothetical protein